MDEKELASLIRYHESGLAQYRFAMSQSAQFLEEMTIKALKGLQTIANCDWRPANWDKVKPNISEPNFDYGVEAGASAILKAVMASSSSTAGPKP